MALVASSGSYYLFHQKLFRYDLVFLDFTTIRIQPGQKYGQMSKDLMLASTQRKHYSLSLSGSSLAIEQEGPYYMEIEEQSQITVCNIAMNRWDRRLFTINGLLELPISGGIVRDGSLLRLTMKNESAILIRDGLFIYRGAPYFVGDFRPGATISDTFRFQPALAAGPPESPWKDLGEEGEGQLYRDVIDLLLNSESWQKLHQEQAILFAGWVEKSILPVSPDREFYYRANLNLVTIVLPVERGNSGQL
jgi:hypothetical protein